MGRTCRGRLRSGEGRGPHPRQDTFPTKPLGAVDRVVRTRGVSTTTAASAFAWIVISKIVSPASSPPFAFAHLLQSTQASGGASLGNVSVKQYMKPTHGGCPAQIVTGCAPRERGGGSHARRGGGTGTQAKRSRVEEMLPRSTRRRIRAALPPKAPHHHPVCKVPDHHRIHGRGAHVAIETCGYDRKFPASRCGDLPAWERVHKDG